MATPRATRRSPLFFVKKRKVIDVYKRKKKDNARNEPFWIFSHSKTSDRSSFSHAKRTMEVNDVTRASHTRQKNNNHVQTRTTRISFGFTRTFFFARGVPAA